MKYCIGVDVGGTTVKLGIFTAEGALLKKWEIKTRCREAGTQFLSDIAAELQKVLSELKIDQSDVAGVGMGIPGPVLPNGYVDRIVNMGIENLYPAKELSTLLGGMKVKAANDANVAALGEMWQGAGKGHHSICMVTLGTGVGGGIVSGGEIIAGMHGAAGEIGHMHVEDNETEPCNCGGYGCLEQYASATGIVRVAKRMLAGSEEPSKLQSFGASLTAKDVCDCAKEGDALSLKALRYSMEKLGLILSHVALCTDPKVFVIGGGVSKAGSILTDMLEDVLKRYTTIIHEKERSVLTATLGNDAGIYGAAKLVLEA